MEAVNPTSNNSPVGSESENGFESEDTNSEDRQTARVELGGVTAKNLQKLFNEILEYVPGENKKQVINAIVRCCQQNFTQFQGFNATPDFHDCSDDMSDSKLKSTKVNKRGKVLTDDRIIALFRKSCMQSNEEIPDTLSFEISSLDDGIEKLKMMAAKISMNDNKKLNLVYHTGYILQQLKEKCNNKKSKLKQILQEKDINLKISQAYLYMYLHRNVKNYPKFLESNLPLREFKKYFHRMLKIFKKNEIEERYWKSIACNSEN
uniref:Uncharacterized protein n=1 Tax=Tetranychus urticae TaxID=32264 RepID=T1L5E0_TETUR